MANPPPSITLQSHPPERRRGAPVTLCAGCCCCCCLHTVGGLIGAATASARPPRLPSQWRSDEEILAEALAPTRRRKSSGIQSREGEVTSAPTRSRPVRPEFDEDVFDMRQPSRLSAAALFWYLSLAFAGLGLAYSLSRGGPSGLLVGIVILLLVFPAVQLVAAAVVCVVLLFSTRYDNSYQLGHLGRITVGLVIGTLVGIGIMFLIALPFR